MSPGYDLCPSVSSVAPSFTLARTKASIEAAELSGIAARRMRPDRVSRYFARFRLGLVGPAVDHLDGAGDEDLPGFHRIKKAVVGAERNFGLVDLHHALQRLALGIDHRSSELLRQQPSSLVRAIPSAATGTGAMPSWASSWTADMPLECVAMRCAAQNLFGIFPKSCWRSWSIC